MIYHILLGKENSFIYNIYLYTLHTHLHTHTHTHTYK
jgi:hypothetical protein